MPATLSEQRRRDSVPGELDALDPVHARIDKLPLVISTIGTVPAMFSLFVSRPHLGAKWLFAWLFAWLLYFLLRSDGRRVLILIISCLPAVVLLRKYSYHNTPLMVQSVGFLAAYLYCPRSFRRMVRVMWPWFLVGGFYWLVSVATTGRYHTNLRVFDLLLAVGIFAILAQTPRDLATSLLGFCITMLSMAVAFLPHGDRLGTASIDGVDLGNPANLGIPLAFLFILLFLDKGRRMHLDSWPTVRSLLVISIVGFLLLSTSRVGWATVLICTGVALMKMKQRQRTVIVSSVAVLLVVSIVVISQTGRWQDVTHAYDKTFSNKYTLDKRTTGRMVQWKLFMAVLPDLPPWGFGAGSGPEAYATYSKQQEWVEYKSGEKLHWHAMYLHVGIETGLIGLAAILYLLSSVTHRASLHWQRVGDPLPLVAAIGYMIVAATVSGLDMGSGMFLGAAMCGHRRLWTRDFFRLHPQQQLMS